MNNNTALDLNISSYYIDQLSSPDISTWHNAGRLVTHIIKHLGRNKHHRKTVGTTWKMVNECIEKGIQYTEKIIQNIQVDLTF